MQHLRLLVVEDDNDTFNSYEDAVEDILEDSDCEVKLYRAKNVEEAKNILTEFRINGAIVDLNLDSEDPSEADGNKVLKIILESNRFPVAVVSGDTSNLEESFASMNSHLLQVLTRGDLSNTEIINSINAIHENAMGGFLGQSGDIEKKMASIYWNHIASDSSLFEKDSEFLLRYTVGHLAEYLDHDLQDGKFYEEAEFYITPPIKKFIATGDIIKRGGELFVVLSPACDIAHHGACDAVVVECKANKVVLAKVILVSEEMFIENKIIKIKHNKGDRKNQLKNIINGKIDKYIFLPEYRELKASIISLESLTSINIDELSDGSINRLATIASPFLKDIQGKLSAYYSRQGQPDLNKTELTAKYLERIVSPIL